MRMRAIALCITLVFAWGVGASTDPSPAPQLRLRVAEEGSVFGYTITHPELVRAAWLEVLDRPVLLDRKDLKVQASGEVSWNWDESSLGYPTEQEDDLSVSIYDPNGTTLTCDGLAISESRNGGLVSRRTLGSRGKFAPVASLDPLFVRFPQDSPQVSFDVTGSDLTRDTTFIVDAAQGASCSTASLRFTVQDLAHARMTLSGDCLQKPGVVSIYPAEGGHNFDAPLWVVVASSASPVLHSVSPKVDRSHFPQEKLLELTVRGRGFTKESTISTGYFPVAGGLFSGYQMRLDVEYVSPTELRAQVDPEFQDLANDDWVWSHGEKLRIWVSGNEDRHELSEPRDLNFDAARAMRQPKTAVITSVSPYPIKPMTEHSPAELKVTIRGVNFIPEDKVQFDFGHFGPHEQVVRSEYVSPTMLRAWIPRKLWRKHQITYRLVVETISGERYSQRVDATSDDP
jgi:hypothetical protein